MTTSSERAVVFNCGDNRLIGIHHVGDRRVAVGVVIIVGGPQYRVGSHRQFVLMARALAKSGISVFRFDYRGMGDAEGSPHRFDSVSEDIRSAIDRFLDMQPELNGVVLVGLCDAASAAMIYGHTDERVRGLALLNPWVRTERGEAKAYIKHYYAQRLLQREFWKKLFSGRLDVLNSMGDFAAAIYTSRKKDRKKPDSQDSAQSFIDRMRIGLRKFTSPVLFLMSERDLTAKEFIERSAADKSWSEALDRSNIRTVEFTGADHTMSSRVHLNAACRKLIDWMQHIVADSLH